MHLLWMYTVMLTDPTEHEKKESDQNQNRSTTVPVANGHYLAMVPGNRRPINLTLAEHFAKFAPPPPLVELSSDEQVKLDQYQQRLQAQERQRLERHKQLEVQRKELLQLQLQEQQQQEQRRHRQVVQWQLELEQQYRQQQYRQQQYRQQQSRSSTGLTLSPSTGLCTIYEAMETSDEDEADEEQNGNKEAPGKRAPSSDGMDRRQRPQELEWNNKVDMVQQLINQTLMLSGGGGCPPLLLLPVGAGGTLSPLKSNMWPNMLPQFSSPVATVTSVSSYSPDSRGSTSPGDWTVVEVETQH